METIIVYYSHTGNNRYMAYRAAAELNCKAAEIKPRAGIFPFLLLSSATKLSWGIKNIDEDFSQYDSVILCGPIWMGQIISPLYDFLKKYKKQIKKLHLITCCGSKDSTKEDKFGYNHVFKKLEALMNEKTGTMEAFPIELILPEKDKKDDQAMMNARLNDSTFKGEIEKRLLDFTEKLTASSE